MVRVRKQMETGESTHPVGTLLWKRLTPWKSADDSADATLGNVSYPLFCQRTVVLLEAVSITGFELVSIDPLDRFGIENIERRQRPAVIRSCATYESVRLHETVIRHGLRPPGKKLQSLCRDGEPVVAALTQKPDS